MSKWRVEDVGNVPTVIGEGNYRRYRVVREVPCVRTEETAACLTEAAALAVADALNMSEEFTA